MPANPGSSATADITRAELLKFLRSPFCTKERTKPDGSVIKGWLPWETPDGFSPQRDFLMAFRDYRNIVFRCGNRNGKSEAACIAVLLSCLGWHRWSKFRGPQRWWVSALDWDMGIGQVIWPIMREWIPWDQVKNITYRRKVPPLPLHIEFKNGSLIEFKSADSGARKYQGAKIHGLWADEEHPQDVIEEARVRLMDHQGYFLASLTPVQRLRWVLDLERETSPDGSMATKVVRSSMFHAAQGGIIPMHEVEAIAARLPERQRRCRVYGDYVALEGLVYPTFDPDKHCVVPIGNSLWTKDTDDGPGQRVCEWPLPNAWPRYAAMDFGYAVPAAVGVGAHDPKNGHLILTNVYYAQGIRSSVWADHLNRLLPPLECPLICDHDAAGRAELEAKGIRTLAARKDLVQGLNLFERLLEPTKTDGLPALLLVDDSNMVDYHLGRCDAHALRHELENYHYPPPRIGAGPDRPDRPVSKNDHACDMSRYMCAGLRADIKGETQEHLRHVPVVW